MSSELNSENGGLLYAKIDPEAQKEDQEEKQDTPKSEVSRTDPHNYYRDVYSSSPEEDEALNLAQEADDQFIQITISEPHKIGEGISSFMAYKVYSKSNMKIFRKDSFCVTRRFSDFLGKTNKYGA